MNGGQQIAPDAVAAALSRKPYNPTDYCSDAPQTEIATAPQFQGAVSTARTSQVFTYPNGTQKEVMTDGTTTISFANGDKKRTYSNEKKGIVVYYYAATKVS